jgi:hypothetical protein
MRCLQISQLMLIVGCCIRPSPTLRLPASARGGTHPSIIPPYGAVSLHRIDFSDKGAPSYHVLDPHPNSNPPPRRNKKHTCICCSSAHAPGLWSNPTPTSVPIVCSGAIPPEPTPKRGQCFQGVKPELMPQLRADIVGLGAGQG